MKRSTGRLLAGALILLLAVGSGPAHAKKKILINFEPEAGDLDGDINVGALAALKDSAIVMRLDAADATMNAQQIADMLKASILAEVQMIYMDVDVEFTTDKNAGGIDKTIHVVGGARDKDGSLGFVRGLNSAKGWVMVDQYDQQDVWIEPDQDRKLTKAEAVHAIGKTVAHELGHLFGLPDVNTMRAANSHTPAGGGAGTAGATKAIKPAAGTMVQGITPDKTPFKDDHLKKLQKDIGKPAEGKKKKDVATTGDKDLFNQDEPGSRAGFEDVGVPRQIPGVLGPPDFDGTDATLPGGQLVLPLLLPPTFDPFLIDSAFLEIRTHDVVPIEMVQLSLQSSAPIPVPPVDLLAPTMDGVMNEFALLDQPNGEYGSVLMDLSHFASLGDLIQILGTDPLLVIEGGGFAVDYVELTVFSVPEPAGFAIFTATVVVAAYRRRPRR